MGENAPKVSEVTIAEIQVAYVTEILAKWCLVYESMRRVNEASQGGESE
jgi:hypothetical protein